MTRIVADTNVYVSALMFGGLPGIFLDVALLESFTLVASAQVWSFIPRRRHDTRQA